MEENLTGSSISHKMKSMNEIVCADLLKYYHRPNKNLLECGDIIQEDDDNEDIIWELSGEIVNEDEYTKFYDKSTQTDYRESEAQTDPWDPPFKVVKIHKDPEVLALKGLTFGNGLPASMLEINYMIETLRNKELLDELEGNESNNAFVRKKQVYCNQIKENWKYKAGVESKIQNKKFEKMKSSLLDELSKMSEKRKHILKNIWNRKIEEINKKNLKLEEKIGKEMKIVERRFMNNDEEASAEKPQYSNSRMRSDKLNEEMLEENADYLLNNYFVTNVEELSTIKDWLEKKQTVLKNKVPLPRLKKRTQREQLAEEAYQDILIKRRTKMPPAVYREDYEREEVPLPPAVVPDDISEYLDFDEQKVDMVTVWQQILRGLAHQKQMLQLIEKHKDALDLSLSKPISE